MEMVNQIMEVVSAKPCQEYVLRKENTKYWRPRFIYSPIRKEISQCIEN
jgi:hypothetical protein